MGFLSVEWNETVFRLFFFKISCWFQFAFNLLLLWMCSCRWTIFRVKISQEIWPESVRYLKKIKPYRYAIFYYISRQQRHFSIIICDLCHACAVPDDARKTSSWNRPELQLCDRFSTNWNKEICANNQNNINFQQINKLWVFVQIYFRRHGHYFEQKYYSI